MARTHDAFFISLRRCQRFTTTMVTSVLFFVFSWTYIGFLFGAMTPSSRRKKHRCLCLHQDTWDNMFLIIDTRGIRNKLCKAFDLE